MNNYEKALLTAVLLIPTLCSCGGTKINTEESEQDSSISTPAAETASIFGEFVGDYPSSPLKLLSESDDEIAAQINSCANLKCSDNLYINIPESATLYEFTTYGTHVSDFDYSAEQYKSDFYELFNYFIPNHEIDESCLTYTKYLSDSGEYETGLVSETDSLPDIISFTYDEAPEEAQDWTNPVYVDLAAEIGNGYARINKGEAVYLAGKTRYDTQSGTLKSSDTYNTLSDFDPTLYFPTVALYTPKSEESYALLDGEIKICDAVNFFEEYINNAPISTGLTRNMRTGVYSVEVLKLGENL